MYISSILSVSTEHEEEDGDDDKVEDDEDEEEDDGDASDEEAVNSNDRPVSMVFTGPVQATTLITVL